jgi:hypothetical protein
MSFESDLKYRISIIEHILWEIEEYGENKTNEIRPELNEIDELFLLKERGEHES